MKFPNPLRLFRRRSKNLHYILSESEEGFTLSTHWGLDPHFSIGEVVYT